MFTPLLSSLLFSSLRFSSLLFSSLLFSSLLFSSLLKCFPLAPVLNHAKHFTGPAPADAPQIKGFANLAGFTVGKISRLKNAASFGGTSDPYVEASL